MRKSLYLARCFSSLLKAETRVCVLSSAILRPFHPVSAIQVSSTSKLSRGHHGENCSVRHEENERRTLSPECRSAMNGPAEDTLLSIPGSLSADEKREQLFISDTNHHRIIVLNGNGKILDCIGSSPGFEDGTFETARLFYPSSTAFDEHSDCLYIADSKNQVIRRASMRKRTVDTVGQNVDEEKSPVWRRFSTWMQSVGLATRKNEVQQMDEDVDRAQNNIILSNPWHLKLASDGSLVVASIGFDSLWVLEPNSGQCYRIHCGGSESVFEEFKRRSDAPKETFEAFSLIHPSTKQQDMVSRVANICNNFFYLDTEGHIVRKMDLQTGNISTLQLSNFGCLGLPAWWSVQPLSLLNVDRENGSMPQATWEEEMTCHKIQVQPGRCIICIDPVLPEGMALAAPVEDHSVWRQARGSIVELSVFGGKLISHKVSGAQQWVDDFDELDNDSDSFDEVVAPQQSEHGLPLYCFIDASLGSGEVLVDAVLYLKPVNSGSTHVVTRGSRINRDSNYQGVKTSSAGKPDVQKDAVTDQEDTLRLRNLQARVRIEVTNTVPSERTNVISIQL